jgi:uridylate kinase
MAEQSDTPIYKRILLKLSGEALMGNAEFGIDPAIIERVATEVRELVDTGIEVAIYSAV